MSAIPYIPSIAVDNVISALGAFLTPFVGGATIVRGQPNRAAMPGDPFVVLTEILQMDLETPIVSDSIAGAQRNVLGPKRIDVQIDFYGASSGDYCTAVKTVYRTNYACSQFPAGIAPLFCSNGRQTPLISGEQQYESRWTITASLQYNPSVYLPQQFADELKLNLVEDLL